MYMQDLEEQLVEINTPEITVFKPLIPTYATQSMTPANFNVAQHPSFASFIKLAQSPKTSAQISLQEEIFRHNAQLVRSAVIQYLKLSLGQKFYETRGGVLKNILTPKQSTGYYDQEPIQEFITAKNKLLSNETQMKICNYIRQYQQISSLFRELKGLIGTTLTHQFGFVVSSILIHKFDSFKKLQDNQILQIIPQIERFWGDEGEQKLLPNGWEVYEDFDYSSIKKFAVEKIEDIASKLYYTSELKYLNLSQVEINSNQANARFSALVCFFAETLFLTMSGMRQQKQDLEEFLQQLNMDMSSGEVQNENPIKRAKLQ